MTLEGFENFCINQKGVTKEFPFDKNILVYKVMGKMFVLTHVEYFSTINLKCNPNIAINLREKFSAVTPGYHMNKKHWITVSLDGSISDQQIMQWINDSYQLVVKKLSKSKRLELLSL